MALNDSQLFTKYILNTGDNVPPLKASDDTSFFFYYLKLKWWCKSFNRGTTASTSVSPISWTPEKELHKLILNTGQSCASYLWQRVPVHELWRCYTVPRDHPQSTPSCCQPGGSTEPPWWPGWATPASKPVAWQGQNISAQHTNCRGQNKDGKTRRDNAQKTLAYSTQEFCDPWPLIPNLKDNLLPEVALWATRLLFEVYRTKRKRNGNGKAEGTALPPRQSSPVSIPKGIIFSLRRARTPVCQFQTSEATTSFW